MDARPHALGTEDLRECWICLAAGGRDLIAPCGCRGSTRWVHRVCLDHWRTRAPNPRVYMHCRHCDFRYLLERRLVHSGADEEQGPEAMAKRRRRLMGQAVRHFATNAALLQLLLLLLAAAICLLDTEERLAGLLALGPLEEPCAARGGTFLDTLRCHKVAYYLAALACWLAVAGAMGAARACLWAVRRHYARYSRCVGGECAYLCCFACDLCIVERPGGVSVIEVVAQSSRAIALVGAVAFATLVVAGAFFVIAGGVTWAQHVVQCYLQAAELGALSVEFVVRDLSAPLPASRTETDRLDAVLLGELNAVYGLGETSGESSPAAA